MKKRIDKLVVERGLAETREKAQALIMAGNVLVDDTPATKAGMPVSAGTEIGLAGYGPGRDEPGVYFEVRDRQKASDPIAWLR